MIELKEKNVTAVARPVAVAVVVASPDVDPTSTIELGEKQGSKFCGSCCDLRRAVIILAIVAIVGYSIIAIIALAFVGVVSAVIVATEEQGENSDGNGNADIALGFGIVAIIFLVMPILFFVFQLVAAIKYNVCMLVTVVVFQCINLVVGLLGSFTSNGTMSSISANPIASIAIWAIFVYPTVGLILEIKKGIMSKENYPREAYSCCCV